MLMGSVGVGIMAAAVDLSKSKAMAMFSTEEDISTPSDTMVQEVPVTEGASAARKALKSTSGEASSLK